MSWLATAEECCRDEYGSLRRGLLTSVFGLVVGLRRIFHLEQMEDLGFALLTGGWKCPSRHLVGGWRRHLTWHEVDRFCRCTSPWDWIADLTDKLPDRYHGAHVSTARRTFFNQPGQVYLTPNTLIVQFDRFAQQEALLPLIDSLNQQSLQIPWLNNRRLAVSTTPADNQPRAGP